MRNLFFGVCTLLVVLGAGCTQTVVTDPSDETNTVVSTPAERVQTETQDPATPESSDVYVTFTLNTQDFSYPEKSADVLKRVLDLHEQLAVPLDVYLTTTMVDWYSTERPEVFAQLKNSSVATVSYHIRPPLPYHNLAYDVAGVTKQTGQEQYDTILEYETHGLDLTTGEPTEARGGFAKLTDLLGTPALAVGSAAAPGTGKTLRQVYKDLGATFVVENSGASNLGEKQEDLYVRPQHADIKLFEMIGEDPATIFATAESQARTTSGAKAPYFLNVKMHDNDFFAEDSAWTTVYLGHGARKGPPYDTSYTSELLTDAEAEAVWNQYESTVRYVSESSTLPVLNLRDVKILLGL